MKKFCFLFTIYLLFFILIATGIHVLGIRAMVLKLSIKLFSGKLLVNGWFYNIK